MYQDVKSFLKLFLPPIVLKLRKCLKGKRNNSFYSSIQDAKKFSETLLIFGNGPSLKESIKKYMSIFVNGNYDILVVNNILFDDCYEKIKPQYHMFMDPDQFIPLENMSDSLRVEKEKFVKVFSEKVCWDVFFIIPSFARKSWVLERLKENSYIHPVFINTDDYSYYETDSEKFKLWDKNLIRVPSQTVLNTSVYYGVFKRYKNIYLFGADTNWTEQIHVDQETNQVYKIDEHFYGKEFCPLFCDVEAKIPSKLHYEILCIGNALKLYWDLKAYADYAGVNVYNASEYSLIDAFDRKKI